MTDYTAFASMEKSGWTDETGVADYFDLFSPITGQCETAILDAARIGPGARVLDLCCGHASLAARAAASGATVTGADFSPAFLDLARAKVPGGTFELADAQDLPFPDHAFDAVVSGFGVCHVPDQQKAIAEAHRTLAPGGRFAMTVWAPPHDNPAFGLIVDAVRTQGDPDITLPPEPGFHHLADAHAARAAFATAGFRDTEVRTLDCLWQLDNPDALFDVFAKGTVRMRSVVSRNSIERQDAMRQHMRAAIDTGYRQGPQWHVPMRAVLIAATR